MMDGKVKELKIKVVSISYKVNGFRDIVKCVQITI